MLYQIIFPALVVLSLVGIIVFLIKKAPKVAELEGGELKIEDGNNLKKKNFWERFRKRKEKKESGVELSHKFLLILEKTIRKLKLFFLKLENLFTGWSELIRAKRRAKEDEIESENLDGGKSASSVENKIDEIFKRKQEQEMLISKREEIKQENNNEQKSLTEKPKKSKKPIEKKDLFEKILIERIAANPKDIEAYERLGEYYLEIENWNYAKECYKQVLKLNPRNIGARGRMRRLEKMLGK